MERELGRLANEILKALWIALARCLDQDAVIALALDAGLGRAELVEAQPDGLDRLLHDGVDPLGQPRIGEGEADQAVIGHVHLEFIHRLTAEDRGDQRIDQIGEPRAGVLETGKVADTHLHALSLDAKTGVADTLILAQAVANVAFQRFQALLDVVGSVNLIEKIGSSLKVETKHDLALGEPVGQRVESRLRQEVRQGADRPGENDEDDQGDLPAREIEHGGAVSRASPDDEDPLPVTGLQKALDGPEDCGASLASRSGRGTRPCPVPGSGHARLEQGRNHE